ncbi:putative membrane protein [Haloferula luteola]|uniref:Putative membrane protein n=1 Tax=Haloferula luteola TaxID=595692 RepID=A0A840UX23_9BACT|nr:hypothetical protein [Haloferula luteola]MBB5350285.1 putative membrane protein [Haloferula luteola]
MKHASHSKTRHSLLLAAAAMPCVMQAAQIDVISTQTVTNTTYGSLVHAINTNTTWTKDNVYVLTDKVFVTGGATLTIEPGTKVYSTLDDKGTSNKDDDAFGAIVVTRGSKINAAGTADEPILFTTTDELEFELQDDVDGDGFIAEFPSYTTYSRWGGVVLLGSAPITIGGVGDGSAENSIEGFQPGASADVDDDGRADVIEYGGNNAADNSGVMTYCIIRHGGYVYNASAGHEINGLTLGGVGSGTTLSHIEVFANADDGVEFFGGTVNTDHFAMVFNQDDSFDIDEGHKGTHQFWFAVQAPYAEDGASSGHDNGGEWDGTTGTIVDSTANSSPTIYNATFIGAGTTAPVGNDKGNNAIYIDDRFAGKVYNSVFDDYSEDLIESSSDGPGTGLTFANNTVGRFGGGTPGSNLTYLNGAGAATTFFDASGNPINGNSNANTDPAYLAYSRDASTNELSYLDPRPSSTSPLLVSNGATLQSGAPVTTDYRGAFGSDNWLAGWTTFDARTYTSVKVDVIAEQTVTNTSFGSLVHAINTNTTWTSDKVYILTDKVFVTNGATLTIEPGTKVYSTLNDQGTSNKDDDAFGAIVVTRGSQIDAQGTAEEPIIFTTTDELEAASALDIDGDGFVATAPTYTTYARWGGVVLLGSAPITIGGVGDGSAENSIEGFQPGASADVDDDGRADVIEYGGSNAADSSGIMTYCSIRHGGYVYNASAGHEINGLTLGGVGNGTTLSHIEVFANADDGVEFFGGTVNTDHFVMAFNQDDSFDIDEGHKGTHQFWFAVQTPFAEDGASSGHDNGGEWDGTTGTIVDSTANSSPTIYNATFIGAGTTAPVGNDKGNNAIYIDDRFAGKVYNSVFDDYREHLIESSSDGPGTGLTFAYNTIGRFGGGSYTGSNASNLTFLNGAGAANTFFNASGSPINGNSNGGTNPMYRSYSRDGFNELLALDPRPASGSPLWTNKLQSGAPVATTYRGAFGADNWAAGWTSFSASGILLGEAPTTGGGEAPFADVDNDGISDTLEATAELQALGFSVGVNDSALFDSIYTESSILDLVTDSQVILQAEGSNVELALPVYKSGDLNEWTPAGDLQLTLPMEGNKQFYRIDVNGAQ